MQRQAQSAGERKRIMNNITVKIKLSEQLKDLRAVEHMLAQKSHDTTTKLATVRSTIDIVAGKLAACSNE